MLMVLRRGIFLQARKIEPWGRAVAGRLPCPEVALEEEAAKFTFGACFPLKRFFRQDFLDLD